MGRHKLLIPLLVWLLVVLVSSTIGYIRIMYGNQISGQSVVDGLYFSVQTVTTVGYGNWQPSTSTDTQVFWVKVISIPTMLAGASLFAAAIAVAVEWARG